MLARVTAVKEKVFQCNVCNSEGILLTSMPRARNSRLEGMAMVVRYSENIIGTTAISKLIGIFRLDNFKWLYGEIAFSCCCMPRI